MADTKFVKSVTQWSQFPAKAKWEIAIAGRSNSGKSSFINALAKHNLAKVSQKPGKTRLLNIFDYQQQCYLVDMPGYGFAARSMVERRQWEKMIESYLLASDNLVGMILVMDIRRNWTADEDLLYQFCLAQEIPLLVALTKADKLSRSRWKSALLKMQKQLALPTYAISSEKNWGVNEVMGFALRQWVFPRKSCDKPVGI